MPNKSKLGVYLAPAHDNWKQYLFDIDPGFIRILMPGDSPADLVSQVHQICPAADISLRWWDLDDGGDESKRRHLTSELESYPGVMVNEAFARLWAMEDVARKNGLPFPKRTQIWFNTINEPEVNDPAYQKAVNVHCSMVATNVAKIDSQVRTLIGEVSVGNPNSWPPQWGWFQGAIDAITKYKGALALHEYWQPEGPFYVWTDNEGKERKDWGALAGRYQHVPYNVPIYITESGVDGRIYNRHATPDTGWRKFMDATTYAGQTAQYHREVKKDARIQWVTPFETDVQDNEWWSFDTLPAREAFDRMLALMDVEVVGGSEKPAVYIPAVGTGWTDVPVRDGIIDPYVARAIFEVESGGNGYGAGGRLLIRFEAHIFEGFVGDRPEFSYNKDNILEAYYNGQPIHSNQLSEWGAFEVAKQINRVAAFKSISMGAAQIMGFNHSRVGFASPEAMFNAFAQDSIYQFIGFVNYCLGDNKLMDAMRAKDWRTIARLYNGAGLVDLYSGRLERAYNKLIGVK